jgi:GT2 family glycosyltransferase
MTLYIILVTYNAMPWLSKCLESTKPYTVIVVDNNSADDTVNFIKANYPEVTLLEQNKNLGFGKANNIGISLAMKYEADYVFLLNQDAWVQPDTIENLVSAHQREPQFGILSPMHLNGKRNALDYNFSIYIQPTKCKNLYSDVFLNTIKNELYEVEFVNAAAWLLSKKCIEVVGGFNPSFFHYGEDNNYLQRATYHKLKVGILSTATICHDREAYSKNPYFTDKISLYKRTVVVKASNPLDNFSFKKEYRKQCKNVLKSIVFLRIEGIKNYISRIKVLSTLDEKDIIENRIKSMTGKLTFLE